MAFGLCCRVVMYVMQQLTTKIELFHFFSPTRGNPDVRRTSAVRPGVRTCGGNLIYGSDSHRAAHGGSDCTDLALAHGGGRVLQPRLLPRLARLSKRVFW